ncbi:MAG: glycosyltransferase family 4 protein [Planctomycetota bacterium]
MQAALIANTAWLDEELATLHHVVVGLLDESVRVVQVLPEGRAEGEIVSFGKRLSWRERAGKIRNRRALNRLADPLKQEGIELIHALDGRQWRAALDLGKQLQLPVVLSANSGLDIELATRCASRLVPSQHTLLCATEPLTQLIDQAVGGRVPVQHVPFGVHVGKHGDRTEDETPCIVISGNGGFDGYVDHLLEGAKQAVAEHPDLQLFFDAQREQPRALWRAISRQGLLANATLIPRRLGHRELLLRADAMVHPQPLGRSRSLTLRAMAHGVPVIACADPLLDDLIDGQTARVLHDPSPETWASTLISLANDPAHWVQLGKSAQRWVAEHRLAATQLEHLIRVYRQLTGEPIVFPGQQASAV